MPTFSVVIPAYNGSQHIDSAIRSVLAQTCPAHEIIVVDDGSTDGTREIAASYGDQVRLIAQRNLGTSEARNTGVRSATGDWIALLDHDDQFLPDKLERQGELIERVPGLVLVYSGFHVESGAGVVRTERAPPVSEIWPALRYRCAIRTSSAVISRSALMDIGGFDPAVRFCEDWQCWLRLVRRFSPAAFGVVPDPLCTYRIWDGNSSRHVLAALQSIENVVEQAIADLPPLRRALWRQRILARHYAETSISLREEQDPRYLEYMRKSLLAWPLWGKVVPLRRYKVAAHMSLVSWPTDRRRRAR